MPRLKVRDSRIIPADLEWGLAHLEDRFNRTGEPRFQFSKRFKGGGGYASYGA